MTNTPKPLNVGIKELSNAVIHLHRHHPQTALMMWMYAILMSGVVFLLPILHSGWQYWFVVDTLVIGGFLFIFLATSLQALVVRIRAGDGGPEWDVMVNGVTSGKISDAAYASIRRDVILDPRVYLVQLGNLIHVALRITVDFLVVIPVLLFWATMTCAVFDPEYYARIILEIQKVTPGVLAANVSGIHEMLVLLFIIYSGGLLIVGHPLGFINCFDEAVSNCVRRAIACASTGDVFLVRFDESWGCHALTPLKKIKRKAGEFVHP